MEGGAGGGRGSVAEPGSFKKEREKKEREKKAG